MGQNNLRLEIFQKMSELATAAFGLVAALAWNDAIQAAFKLLFGSASELWAKFVYAILVTALVVLITLKLGNILNKIKSEGNNGESSK